MTLLGKTVTSREMTDRPPEDRFVWRVLYADSMPVSEWTVQYGTTQAEVFEWSLRRAQRDLDPGSVVVTNVFIIQHWHDEEWDDYDAEGNDYADLCFED